MESSLVYPRGKEEKSRNSKRRQNSKGEQTLGYLGVVNPVTSEEDVPLRGMYELDESNFKNMLTSFCEMLDEDPNTKEFVWCCLTQKDEKGNYRPIAFVSQKFNKTQRNWATIEKEAYAILFGFKKFDKWLHGTIVEIVTDHNPLKYLIEKTPKSPKLTRWALALQRWSYKITHRPGILNQDADALSRLQTK
ncbi:hypothetical protein AVEN_264330-1 [Araneus ventricosus]|uniref:Reverse transcriptase RNase H-like domain-containing protein n=1 Tax=Araneus ventricosus TaxID=182803 RepID=A0A4Y2H7N3_ARAVE|nr:hypothetical protein AVEN_264330-1 [Araneus ventricosus]